jgi:hypothetical protein
MREKISSEIRDTDKMDEVFFFSFSFFFFSFLILLSFIIIIIIFKLDGRVNLASLRVYTLGRKRVNHGLWIPVKYLTSYVTIF